MEVNRREALTMMAWAGAGVAVARGLWVGANRIIADGSAEVVTSTTTPPKEIVFAGEDDTDDVPEDTTPIKFAPEEIKFADEGAIRFSKAASASGLPRWPREIEVVNLDAKKVLIDLLKNRLFLSPYRQFRLRGMTDTFQHGEIAGDFNRWQMHGNWPYLLEDFPGCIGCGPASERLRWYGVDATPEGGDNYLYSPAGGIITEIRHEGGWGIVVSVLVSEYNLLWSFLHVGTIRGVEIGQMVKPGEPIARYGGVPTHISVTFDCKGKPAVFPFQELISKQPEFISAPNLAKYQDKAGIPSSYWVLETIRGVRGY